MKRTKPLKRKTLLRKVSKKRQPDMVRYRNAIKVWREELKEKDGYPRCEYVRQVNDPVHFFVPPMDDNNRCCYLADYPPHHMKGRRGSLLYDKQFFMAVCSNHHRLIHDNAKWARKRGYILYA